MGCGGSKTLEDVPAVQTVSKPSDKPSAASSTVKADVPPGQPAEARSDPSKEVAKKKGQSITANVLGRETGNVKDHFTIGRELGRGQFGITYLCTDNVNKEQLACKSIAKRKLLTTEDVEDVKREVAIMYHLADHPNVVHIRGAYEDKLNVHIVMELCAGGELFDRILARGHYSEKAAAALLRTIVSVVDFCHQRGVIHRDLKPENFLLLNKKEDSPLKTTDFGLSVFYKPGEVFSDIVGSAYYVAPEVLRRRYGPEADIWSCGVILYILLCGVPPFWAEDEQGIFNAVLKGHIDFETDPWPEVSRDAKELIRAMLKQDANGRITAAQVLNHPWVNVDGTAPDKELDRTVLGRLKQFSTMNKMKKLALRVIASNLAEEEVRGLQEMFMQLDTDNSGSITLDELRVGLKNSGTTLPENQLQELMRAADVDNSGTIDYSEFVTATMQLTKFDKNEHLVVAFKHFDKDNSGEITEEELRAALSSEEVLEPGEIEQIISEVDTNKDGVINFSEFVDMMKKGIAGADGGALINKRRG